MLFLFQCYLASHVAVAPPHDHSKLITNVRKADSPPPDQGPESPKHQKAWESNTSTADIEEQNNVTTESAISMQKDYVYLHYKFCLIF